MFLTSHGLGCFKIQFRDATLITDPFQDSLGWKLPKAKAEIVTMSDPGSDLTNNSQRIIGEPLVIQTPGEYESKKAFVYGVARSEEKDYPSMFLIEAEDIFIAHLGLMDDTLSDKHLEVLEGADILLLPLQTLKEKAAKVISQIEPRIIIPMYYQLPGLKIDSVPLDRFTKEMGMKQEKPQEKFKISKKDLPAEETQLVILEKI